MCKGVRILKGKPNLWFRPDFLTELGSFEFRATFPGRECFDFECFENAKSVLKGQMAEFFFENKKCIKNITRVSRSRKSCCQGWLSKDIKVANEALLWKISKLPVKLMREKLRETSLDQNSEIDSSEKYVSKVADEALKAARETVTKI